MAREALGLVEHALVGWVMTTIADLSPAQGDPVDQVRAAPAVRRETGHRVGEARTLVLFGRALRATGGTGVRAV